MSLSPDLVTPSTGVLQLRLVLSYTYEIPFLQIMPDPGVNLLKANGDVQVLEKA